MGQVVAVYNFKGGVGKTSTSLNLGLSWARSFRVLLIDCDPQANLTFALTGEKSFDQDLPKITKELLHSGQPEIKPIEVSYYLHLIPGSFQMSELESNSQYISFGNVIIYNLLNTLRHHYDFIILDFPTHFGVTVKSFLANANSILVPAVADSFSTSGIRQLLGYLNQIEKQPPLNLLGIFFNFYRKNTIYHNQVIEEAKMELGKLILDQQVRESIRVSEAQSVQQSIYQRLIDCPVAEDFQLLSEEVIGRIDALSLDQISVEEHSENR